MMKNIFFVLLSLSFTLNARSQLVTYKVYALQFASTGHAFPISDWSLNGPRTDSVDIRFVVWLIKGSTGKNILLDAGFLQNIPDAMEFNVTNYVRPDSAVLKMGIKPGDITDIILSHPHWDHIDGIGLFPNARIWMQKEDYNYFTGGAWQKDANHGGYNAQDVEEIVRLNIVGRVTLWFHRQKVVDGDNKEILPGITVYTGSRHTYNSQYVGVNTGTNKIILASDNI